MEYKLELCQLNELTYEETLAIDGGWDWDSFANFVGSVAVVSSAIPGGQGVTIICGAYTVGYYLGKSISG